MVLFLKTKFDLSLLSFLRYFYPMDQNNTLNQRLKRYASVGSSLGGPAMRLAFSQLLGMPLDQDQHAVSLTQALGNLKGPLVKIAQLLAMIPGFLPDEYTNHLMTLQSNAPPMGPLFVKRRMVGELGVSWQQYFSQFNMNSVAAASLGQVHRAQDHEGSTLAVKLQYPNMSGIVKADLDQLKLFMTLYEKYDSTLDHQEIFREITDRLLEELDYSREAKHVVYFQNMLKDEPEIHIPQVYPHLSTSKLLTLSWQEGFSIMDLLNTPMEIRNNIAKNLFHAWYKPFYTYGILHGDPHMGNYKATYNGSLHLLDFGCVRIFTASFIGGVIDLYKALQQNDVDMAVHAYKAWGFQNLSKELITALNLWAKFLYEPLLDNRIRPLRFDDGVKTAKALLKEIHQALKQIGRTCPPKEFVFLDRSAIGLGSAFMHLKAQLNWHQLFENLIQNFSENNLKQKQDMLLLEIK